MKKLFLPMAGILAVGILTPDLTYAHGGEHHQKSAAAVHSVPPMPGMFLVKKNIDGYMVSFHIMKVKEGMQHGGTHNLMVKVEKDSKVLTNILVNSKVTHPNKESESKMMMKMGDWYMAGYDLEHKGPHQVMVLFKTQDGKKHFGGVTYPTQVTDK